MSCQRLTSHYPAESNPVRIANNRGTTVRECTDANPYLLTSIKSRSNLMQN
jgi:hypothetical protein